MTEPPIDIIAPDQGTEEWLPLPSRLEGFAVNTLSRRQLHNWSLVLEARHIPGAPSGAASAGSCWFRRKLLPEVSRSYASTSVKTATGHHRRRRTHH